MISDRLYRALRREILSGTWKPGDSLPIRPLCKRLGASRTPMREALIRLAQEGFVRIHSRRGVFVTGVSLRELNNIFQVREALEGLAARLACQRPDKEQLDALESELRAARRSGKYQDLISIGMKIHEWVSEASANAALAGIMSTLHGHMTRIFALFANDQFVVNEAYGQYQAILEAIRNGKPDEAEAAMRSHIATTREHLLKAI